MTRYYIYGRKENGSETFEKVCNTFEDALDEIYHLYELDNMYGGIHTYYFMVEQRMFAKWTENSVQLL